MVRGSPASECIFCKIIKGKSPCWKVYEDDFVIAIFDAYPASEYHTLVIPKKHFKDLYDIDEEYLKKIIVACKKISKLYKKYLNITDINLIHGSGKNAQQDIFHFHMHIVPRHKGDKYQLYYTPQRDISKRFDKLLKKLKQLDEDK